MLETSVSRRPNEAERPTIRGPCQASAQLTKRPTDFIFFALAFRAWSRLHRSWDSTCGTALRQTGKCGTSFTCKRRAELRINKENSCQLKIIQRTGPR